MVGPALEATTLWPLFQHGMIMSLGEVLQPSLGDRYRLRTGTRTYVNEQVLFTSIVREEHKEEFLEIRQRSDARTSFACAASESGKPSAIARCSSPRARGASPDFAYAWPR